jgi:hypothetical protein
VSEKPPIRPDEVRRILRELAPLSEDRRMILIGGQAVAFWSAFFDVEAPASESDLFTSADIDFEGAAQTARRAGQILRGNVQVPTIDTHTPNTALVTFIDSDGIEREIDFLSAPYGLTGQDVRDTAIRLFVQNPDGPDAPIWVMHPERCMESRVHNVVGLKQAGRVAIDQLRRSVACAQQFSLFLLDSPGEDVEVRIRAVLNLNERVFKRCRTRPFRDVFFDHEIDPFDAVLVDPRLPDRFQKVRYPQMRMQLEDQRKRSKAQRERYAKQRKR